MRSREDLKKDLQNIQQEVLNKKNTFGLAKADQANLKIVLNTFFFLIENIDKLINSKYTFYGVRLGIAPVHLENHPTGKDREGSLFGSLIEVFIMSYNNVKAANKVKPFCERLAGNCIEMRTRKAFDFGLKFGEKVAIGWNAKLKNLITLLETTSFVGNTLVIEGEHKIEFELEAGADPEAEEDAYLNYLLSKSNRKKLSQMVEMFYHDDFVLTDQNRPIVLSIVEHFCYKSTNTAGELLYRHIHKKDKACISHCIIENDVNLNVTKELNGIPINTLFRAIANGASAETVSNLLDYGATVIEGMEEYTYLAAMNDEEGGALYKLIQSSPVHAQAFLQQLDEEKQDADGNIALMTDEGKQDKQMPYMAAKLKLLKAMATAEVEGCKFTYTQNDKKLFLADLLQRLSQLHSIDECLDFYNDYHECTVLQYDRIINMGAFTWSGTPKFARSYVTFVEEIQKKLLELTAPAIYSKNPAAHTYILLELIRHDIFGQQHIKKGVNAVYRNSLVTQYSVAIQNRHAASEANPSHAHGAPHHHNGKIKPAFSMREEGAAPIQANDSPLAISSSTFSPRFNFSSAIQPRIIKGTTDRSNECPNNNAQLYSSAVTTMTASNNDFNGFYDGITIEDHSPTRNSP